MRHISGPSEHELVLDLPRPTLAAVQGGSTVTGANWPGPGAQ
ncbi:hypothetical protein BH24ACT5_BH24ACT5_23600 [soil metagenome]